MDKVITIQKLSMDYLASLKTHKCSSIDAKNQIKKVISSFLYLILIRILKNCYSLCCWIRFNGSSWFRNQTRFYSNQQHHLNMIKKELAEIKTIFRFVYVKCLIFCITKSLQLLINFI